MAWHRRIWNVCRAARVGREVERELAFHIAARTEELRETGLSPEQAARAARRQFGNFTMQWERTREMDIDARLESAVRNLRYAVRSLGRTPAFTITVLLTLALGIGANSAVFSAIDAVLLRPLPFPEGDRLMQLTQSRPKVPDPFVAPVRLEEWNRLTSVFDGIAGYDTEDTSETTGEIPEKMERAWVTPRFLEVLRVAPALGRGFTPQEERFGGPNAVLISDRLWRRRFGADPHAIGKTLRVPRTAYTIVGVMPPSFVFPDREVDLWCPAAPDAPYAQSRELTWYTAIARLKPGVSLAEARANLAAVQAALGRQFPKTDAQLSTALEPLKEVAVGGVRRSLWLLFGSVSLLLLIACTNIAALLLSRAAGRRHEIALRFSLGASRSTVALQLLTEVLVLAAAGAALGLALAAGASRVFGSLAGNLPRVQEIRLDWRIVLYSLACAMAATLLCGLIPALRGTRQGLARNLGHGGRSQVSGRNPLQFLLVGVQVALAVTLLAGAGLLLRSFQELGRVAPGFDPRHVLQFHISTTWSETANWKDSRARTQRILDGLRALPGVEAATAAGFLPGVPGQYQVELKTTEGRAETEPRMLAQVRWVTPEYFAALRIPLLAGTMCRNRPDRPMAVVNRSFAGLYPQGSEALGRHVLQPDNAYLAAAEITGIVGDARETGLDQAPQPTAYWCNYAMEPGTYFLVRTHPDPAAMVQTIRRKIHELEPLRSAYDLAPLSDRISDAYAENRLRTVLLAFFALAAVALASVGLYGTLSYAVSLRQREVALRMALGALRGQVVRRFLGQGLLVALCGAAAGLALAIALRRMIAGMLFGVSATDGPTLAAVVAIVLAVSALASLLPAMRAARLDPSEALRQE